MAITESLDRPDHCRTASLADHVSTQMQFALGARRALLLEARANLGPRRL